MHCVIAVLRLLRRSAPKKSCLLGARPRYLYSNFKLEFYSDKVSSRIKISCELRDSLNHNYAEPSAFIEPPVSGIR